MPYLRFAAAALVAAVLADGASAQTLRGSPGTVQRTYLRAVRNDLTFFRSARSVRSAAREGDLVRLTPTRDLAMAGVSYPYTLASTRLFLSRLARQYRAECGERLVVTSLTRPRSYRLANSVEKSVHPAGMAVDLRKPSRPRCAAWLRSTLLSVEGKGAIDATEEFRPPHFHVAVFSSAYPRYVRGMAGGRRAAAPARTYEVRRGDTLWTIARRTGVPLERLKSANRVSAKALQPGQTLRIPTR